MKFSDIIVSALRLQDTSVIRSAICGVIRRQQTQITDTFQVVVNTTVAVIELCNYFEAIMFTAYSMHKLQSGVPYISLVIVADAAAVATNCDGSMFLL